ncbi:MAG: hypothetical protein KKE86_16920, partial [Planctomycetes bacterium]|nr:hypothetical protein [Planctomycetota bacterium]
MSTDSSHEKVGVMETQGYFFVVCCLSYQTERDPMHGVWAIAFLENLTVDEAEAVRQAVELEDEAFLTDTESWMESESQARKTPGRYLVLRRQARKQENQQKAIASRVSVETKWDRLTSAAIEHANEVRSLRDRPKNGEQPLQCFEVFDAETQKMVVFDPSGTVSWAPAFEEEGWDPLDMFYHYSTELTLFRHRTGHWTLLAEKSHFDLGSLGPPEARRLNDEEAVDWLVRHGHEAPSDVANLAKNSLFTPGKPNPPQQVSAERIVPSWNKDRRELTFRDTIIKRVRSIFVAKNVVRVLDAFQEDGWPNRIDDPLDPSKNQQRLHETIKRLNDNL